MEEVNTIDTKFTLPATLDQGSPERIRLRFLIRWLRIKILSIFQFKERKPKEAVEKPVRYPFLLERPYYQDIQHFRWYH